MYLTFLIICKTDVCSKEHGINFEARILNWWENSWNLSVEYLENSVPLPPSPTFCNTDKIKTSTVENAQSQCSSSRSQYLP